jgi:hypothetical protein
MTPGLLPAFPPRVGWRRIGVTRLLLHAISASVARRLHSHALKRLIVPKTQSFLIFLALNRIPLSLVPSRAGQVLDSNAGIVHAVAVNMPLDLRLHTAPNGSHTCTGHNTDYSIRLFEQGDDT